MERFADDATLVPQNERGGVKASLLHTTISIGRFGGGQFQLVYVLRTVLSDPAWEWDPFLGGWLAGPTSSARSREPKARGMYPSLVILHTSPLAESSSQIGYTIALYRHSMEGRPVRCDDQGPIDLLIFDRILTHPQAGGDGTHRQD